MAEQPGAEFDIDAIGRMGEQIGSKAAQKSLGQGQDDQARRSAR